VKRLVTLAATVGMAALIASAATRGWTVGAATNVQIEKKEPGTPPDNFDFLLTGDGEPGRWTVVRDTTAFNGIAIEHVSTDLHENRFPLAVYAPISAQDFKVNVRFKIIKGTMQSAGIASRFVDVDNYYVVGASALEERVDLFRVVKGKKERIWGTDADVALDHWHVLEVEAKQDQFTISLDRNWLFTARDSTLPGEGQIGLWTEEDNVTRFDLLEIETFPTSEKRCCSIE
jgi:hypothetical protein